MKHQNICIADPMQQRVVNEIRRACRKQKVGDGLEIREISDILDLDYEYRAEADKARNIVTNIKKQFLGRNEMYGELFGNVDGKYVLATYGSDLYLALIQRGIVYSLKMASGYHKKAEQFASKIV